MDEKQLSDSARTAQTLLSRKALREFADATQGRGDAGQAILVSANVEDRELANRTGDANGPYTLKMRARCQEGRLAGARLLAGMTLDVTLNPIFCVDYVVSAVGIEPTTY
jgi:hypothetical protein